MRRLLSILWLSTATLASAADLPPPDDAESSLLVIEHEIRLADSLDLRSAPSEVLMRIGPNLLEPVVSTQGHSVFVVPAGTYFVADIQVVFRPKRQSGLTNNYRGTKPEDSWSIAVAEHETGQLATGVQAGSIVHAGNLKLVLRRIADAGQRSYMLAPSIETGVWEDVDEDDARSLVKKITKGTEWSARNLVVVSGD